MSNYSECRKGGVSISWKIDNYHSVEKTWVSLFRLKWPKTNSVWDFSLVISSCEANDKCVKLQINKGDNIAPFCLTGAICIVNGKFCFKLKQLDRYDFQANQNIINLRFKPSERKVIDFFEKQGLFINDSLALRINLWDNDINDVVVNEYFIRSRYIKQTCSFHWMLKGDRDWKKIEKHTECSTVIPMQFTDFLHMRKFRINFKLKVEDHNTFAITSLNDEIIKTINYKLKIQEKEGTTIPFLKTEWSEFHHYKDSVRKITEEEWDYLSTEWVVKIEIVVVTPYNSLLEKISHEPSIPNLRTKPSKRKHLSKYNMPQCMYNLYKESKHCDVVFRADSATFRCHKAVLSTRSSVFKAMFENGTTVKNTNEINIDDVESGILEIFFKYLYLDNLTNVDLDSAVKLYKVADKYEVLSLQEECVNIIVSSLSTDNVCEMLVLADSHQDEDLNEDILSYFYDHTEEIVNSSSWKEFLLTKPLLAAKTLEASVANKP